MAGIIFYFEDNDLDVYSGRRIDLDAWKYAATAAGDITEMVVINNSSTDIKTSFNSQPIKVVKDIPVDTEYLHKTFGGNITHVICPWNKYEKTSLWDFDHKTDWYIFGPASGFSNDIKIDKAICVPQSGIGALHSQHIASIVLLHRYWRLSE